MQQKKMKYSEELKKTAPEMSRTSRYIFLKNSNAALQDGWLQYHRFDFCDAQLFLGHQNSSLLSPSPLNGGHTWDRQYPHLEHWFNGHCSVEEGEMDQQVALPLRYHKTPLCAAAFMACYASRAPPHLLIAEWVHLGSHWAHLHQENEGRRGRRRREVREEGGEKEQWMAP